MNCLFLCSGFKRWTEFDPIPVQNLSFLQQSASISWLQRASVWNCGGEPGHEAGDQVVNLQKSSHPDGEWECGQWQHHPGVCAGGQFVTFCGIIDSSLSSMIYRIFFFFCCLPKATEWLLCYHQLPQDLLNYQVSGLSNGHSIICCMLWFFRLFFHFQE